MPTGDLFLLIWTLLSISKKSEQRRRLEIRLLESLSETKPSQSEQILQHRRPLITPSKEEISTWLDFGLLVKFKSTRTTKGSWARKLSIYQILRIARWARENKRVEKRECFVELESLNWLFCLFFGVFFPSLGDITYFRKTQAKSSRDVICCERADEARSVSEVRECILGSCE